MEFTIQSPDQESRGTRKTSRGQSESRFQETCNLGAWGGLIFGKGKVREGFAFLSSASSPVAILHLMVKFQLSFHLHKRVGPGSLIASRR